MSIGRVWTTLHFFVSPLLDDTVFGGRGSRTQNPSDGATWFLLSIAGSSRLVPCIDRLRRASAWAGGLGVAM